MNNVVTLLDNYSQTIPEIRRKLGLPTHDSIDKIVNLSMSMKHRIELIQHIFDNLQRFNWEKLYSFDFMKNEKGEVIQELSGINIIFSNEKLMGNYVTLFLISLVTLSTGIIDSLALLLHDSFLLKLKHVSVATVQRTISVISLQEKLKEMILDNRDYESLKEIREQLVQCKVNS